MFTYTNLPLLPTKVIGSHGVPSWMWIIRDAVAEGKMGPSDIAESLRDAVNVASRLEGTHKHFRTRISVSNSTKLLCTNIAFRPIAQVVLKGKQEPIEVWEPLGEEETQGEYVSRYVEAYTALKSGDARARALLSELAEEAPDAYKDVDRVVEIVERAGLAARVARLRPIGVVKG